MLTDRAKESAERFASLARAGLYVLVVYAVAQRVSVIDSIAVVFVLIEVLRAVRRGTPSGSEVG